MFGPRWKTQLHYPVRVLQLIVFGSWKEAFEETTCEASSLGSKFT